jgi:hypothetical protein
VRRDLKLFLYILPFVYQERPGCHVYDVFEHIEKIEKGPCCYYCDESDPYRDVQILQNPYCTCSCHILDVSTYVEKIAEDPCCSLCILKINGKRILGADYSNCKCDIKVRPDGTFVKLSLEYLDAGESMEALKDPDIFYPVSGNPLISLYVENWEARNIYEEAAKTLDAVLKLAGLDWIYRMDMKTNFSCQFS